MHEVWEGIRWALGLGAEPKTLTFLQMALRTIVMFVAGLTMVRLSGGMARSACYHLRFCDDGVGCGYLIAGSTNNRPKIMTLIKLDEEQLSSKKKR